MGLASATTTALNGMRLNERSIDVLGNNVANAGTRGFKASEALFTTQLVRTLSSGGGPTDSNGGTNPRQVGLGATVSTIRKNFAQGSVTTTDTPTDLAIEGEGFFMVRDGRGVRYTRDGSFTLNPEGKLVNPQGLHVQGYGVDGNFNLETTTPEDLTIPLGKLYIAEATSEATFTGAFFSGGDLATHGSLVRTDPLRDANGGGPGVPGPPSLATPLADVTDAAGNPLFTGADVSFQGNKGDRQLEAQSVPVAGSTLADLAAMMTRVLGIQSGGSVPNDGNTGGPPGVDLDGDRLRIVGNRGTVNDLRIAPGDLRTGGTVVTANFAELFEAVGESAVHDMVVYDSLGQEVQVRLTSVLEGRTNTRTDFRWYADSADHSGASIAVGNGLMQFDGTGEIVAGQSAAISIERENTAALSPLTVGLDFSQLSGISSARQGSQFSLEIQDGSPPGTLVDFAVGESGGLTGVFDNGLLRPLGRVVLAQFANEHGLVEDGGGTYREGPGSGPARLTAPAAFGAGLLRAGAIELSNTDIGKNLVDLIIASTNYRGNARVISSTQELTDELLRLGR